VNPVYSQMSEDYENISNQLHDDDSLDNSTVASASFMGDDDAYGTGLMHYGGPPSRKRKRGHESVIDQEHTFYADQLLDYFVLSASETPYGVAPPRIPDQFQIDRPIDDQHHTALHWGAAMGDLDIVGTFLDRGASPSVRNKRGETPLVRAVLFTNNYEKDTMPQLVHQLLHTLKLVDNHGATVLHHIAMTTNSLAKKKCAQYYLNVVLNKLADYESTHDFLHFINRQDRNGDTALHIVARHNAKKCVRALQGRSARGDIFNSVDETADLIMQKTRSLHHNFISSSPAPEANVTNRDAIVMASKPDGVNHYHSQSARSFSQSFGSMAQDKGLQMALAFESEVKEKDDDLTESQGVLTQIQNQQHQLRQGYLRHLAEDADGSNDNEEQMHREREWRLIKEISSFSEQIQHQDLHRVVRAEDNNVPMSIHEKSNGIASDASALEGQGRAAHALAAQQNKRKRLTTMVVTAQGAAGMSAYGEKLKKLVSITCAMPEDQVLESAPEILDILEQSKGEGARGVAVEG